jgi:predicted transposase YbfD/YdcC
MSTAPSSTPLHPFLLCFDEVYDPRQPHPTNLLHECRDILAIALLATLCGMQDYLEFQDWGDLNHQWLAQMLELPFGIPSESCFRRLFEAIDPQDLSTLLEHVSSWFGERFLDVDGKACRGARLQDLDGGALMMLNAFARDNDLLVSSMAIEPGSNEPGALPAFLRALELQGACVTLDAGGSTRPVAKVIVEGGADYILSIKGNQENTQEALEGYFQEALNPARPQDQNYVYAQAKHTDKGHGRIEIRELYCSQELDCLEMAAPWSGVRSVICLRTTRIEEDKESVSLRYFISTLAGKSQQDAEFLLEGIRGHWSVESRGHWNLDVSFGEDRNQVRSRRGATNLSLIRKAALNMLRRDTETPKRVSLKRRMLRCLMDKAYLLHILELSSVTSLSVP